jgi:NDP-sugar pyrophosphorylase family protein
MPKPLVPIHGRPFLSYLLTFLRRNGVLDVLLCTGYRHEQIQEYCGDGSSWGLRVAYSRETEPLGTAGALAHASRQLTSDPVALLNGDTFLDVSLPEVVAFHTACSAGATLLALRQKNAGEFGVLDADGEGRITAFREKGQTSGAALINAGMYILSREFIDQVCGFGCRPLSLELDVLPQQAVAGNLRAFVGDGYFLDIGTPDRYRRAITELPEVGS